MKMTLEEKRLRRERRRVIEINYQILKLSAVESFYRLFNVEGNEDGAMGRAEISEANRKIAELKKQL